MNDLIDFGAQFDEIVSESVVEYRDPMLEPWGNPDRSTPTQIKAWNFLHEYLDKEYVTADGEKHRLAPRIGLIGAKGSSKTHLCADGALAMGQLYPGSTGCLISNSYQQAKDNGPPILDKEASKLGYEIEFYNKKKVNGKQLTNFYVIRLSATAEFYLLIRSFDAVNKLEGSEIDWGWAEEIQDATKAQLTVFASRIRGQRSPNVIFFAGMPEVGTHWQYKVLPQIGVVEEEKFAGITEQKVLDPDTGETHLVPRVGILYEPSVFENRKNVGMDYINTLLDLYSEEDAQRYVYGKRGSSRSDRVFYQYRDDLHRGGTMSDVLCEYAPHDRLVFAYDFNVYPMSVSVWQPKKWNDVWDDLVRTDDLGADFPWLHVATGELYKSLESYADPDRTVWAQIDELEVYPDDPYGGMTAGMCRHLEDRYLDHKGQVIVLGDASGNQRRSSSDTTDWEIIGRSMKKYIQPIVIRGLISNMDLKAGVTRYSNPSQRDALQNANRFLLDGHKKVHVCFLPKSKLASGGVAASVADLGFNADGSFDVKKEKKMERDVARSHLADTFKYFAWWALPPGKASAGEMAAANDVSHSRDGRERREQEREHRQELDERSRGYVF